MVKFVNPGDKTFGEYGEDGYTDVTSERVYEEHRFKANRAGRTKAKHEMAMVQKFIATLPPNQQVLDAPCGMGRFTDSLKSAGHTPVCVDINHGMLQRARTRHGENTWIVKGDVLALPFEDGAFGAAICFRLLHHLPDNIILNVLTELKRVADSALVTFYDANCFRYHRKMLQRKRVQGQYYTAQHMFDLCEDAGWQNHKHLNPFDFHRNLHGLQLG